MIFDISGIITVSFDRSILLTVISYSSEIIIGSFDSSMMITVIFYNSGIIIILLKRNWDPYYRPVLTVHIFVFE